MLSLGLCAPGSPPTQQRCRQGSTHAVSLPLSQDKPAFREVITQLELDPMCRGLSFSSFLILPFQRITRLKLLVQVEFCSSVLPRGRPDHSWDSIQQLQMRYSHDQS